FGSGSSLRSTGVTMPGGGMVAVQDEIDATKKRFVGGQNLRYTGELKFYDPVREMGYVLMDEGFDVSADVPRELRVERPEVNCSGGNPFKMEQVRVEFGIWKTPKSQHKVYNMTLPGGVPITVAAIENRITHEGSLSGKVRVWNWSQGWGLVQPFDLSSFPAPVLLRMQELHAVAIARGKAREEGLLYFRKEDVVEGVKLHPGMDVLFDVYTDDKGAGAENIR
ncbi:unnamed protein product, partial [Polarella glacialis]